MATPPHTLAHIPRELRLSNLGYGLGVTKLQKLPSPAAAASFTHLIPADYWERILSLAFNLTTSAVAGIRTLAIVFQDQDGNIFNLTPISNEIGPSQNITAYADLASVTPVAVPASHQAEGSQTSPAAGTTIVSLALPSGGWTINWLVQVTGTVGAPEVDNFALVSAGTQLDVSINGNVVGQPYQQQPAQVQIPVGGATVLVRNVNLATVGAVYAAQLTASPANVPAAQVQLPDFLMHTGWQWGIQLGGPQAGDQISGILLLAERYPSDLAGGYQAAGGELFYPGPP
jgi:hypothetical protein